MTEIEPGSEYRPTSSTCINNDVPKQFGSKDSDLDHFMTSKAPLLFFQNNSGSIKILSQTSLRNSLLPTMGFLELANSGDFAANVFNEIPVPTFAAVLMGLGGTVALFMSIFAIWDARLSWQNIVVLRNERRLLLQAASSQVHHNAEGEGRPSLALRTYLDMNTFETRTEIFDRFMMDITLGFGAILVGIGTLMAIAGANPRIFEASNLLSGYIGNGPAALYGLVRMIWSIYVWVRANRHSQAGNEFKGQANFNRDARTHKQDVGADPVIFDAASWDVFHSRYRRIKFYALVAGPTSLVAGAGSLITATRWWGYLILIPCITLSFLCNWYFRQEIGYQRPLFTCDVKERNVDGTQDPWTESFAEGQGFQMIPFREPVTINQWKANHSRETEEKNNPRNELNSLTEEKLLQELQDAVFLRQSLSKAVDIEMMPGSTVINWVLSTLAKLDLFESFYLQLLSSSEISFDEKVQAIIYGPQQKSGRTLGIKDPKQLFLHMEEVQNPLCPTIMSMARRCLSSQGHLHAKYRERYMIEFLGCWLRQKQHLDSSL